MNQEDIVRVSNYLDAMEIKHTIEKENNTILIDRTSIVNNFPSLTEEDSYAALRERLNKSYGGQLGISCAPCFIYVAKSDEWLMLDKIPCK